MFTLPTECNKHDTGAESLFGRLERCNSTHLYRNGAENENMHTFDLRLSGNRTDTDDPSQLGTVARGNAADMHAGRS